MAQQIADRKDIDFVLHEQLRVCDCWKQSRFSEFNRKTTDLILQEARNLAIREILPTATIGDRTGCRYDKGMVKTPAEYAKAWRLLAEGGWFAPCADIETGGQGMPQILAVAAGEYLTGANLSLMMVAGLHHGVGKLIETFGSETQKHLYLKKVHSGEWGGTMVLTEPEAGSDLGRIRTTAVRKADGTFSITGNKIFISGGDQDLTRNIVHAVLARIEDAPEGSRGLSLFLVPKIRVANDGTLGEGNDVVCTGIEEKMGLHGSPTCSLALGGAGGCIGTLLGEENKGLSAMFLMMNDARRMVASQGLACASSAYLHALSWARSRIQGTAPGPDPGGPAPIIRHPDVRRMLLTMKSYTEGMRSLLYYIAFCDDRKNISSDPMESARLQSRMDILTPVAKSYMTDRSFEVCSLAVQVFGGYGYTAEYPVEQLLRDVRITSIYEGTNSIQAMDLLARKLFWQNGDPFRELLSDIRTAAGKSRQIPAIRGLSSSVEAACEHLAQAADHLMKSCRGSEVSTAYAFASSFLDAMGDVVLSWMLLQRADLAIRKLESGPPEAVTRFCEGQIRSAEFFIRVLLPVTRGKMSSILDGCDAAARVSTEAFGGL